MKYLITGLGNIGREYQNTRHNIGFEVLDALAKASNTSFSPGRYGDICEIKFKARTLILLKPSTYVNLSGKAILYWLNKSKIPIENLLVVLDDLALPFGTLRLRPKGGDAGHNGLRNIQEVLGSTDYARLRFGIGNDFARGLQVNYVLGQWDELETKQLPDRFEVCQKIIQSFVTIGTAQTMTLFNNK